MRNRRVVFQRGELHSQLIFVDIFGTSLFESDFREVGTGVQLQGVAFGFGLVWPCSHSGFDIQIGDVAFEELFVVGG